MRVADLEDLYELSPAQQGILFHCVHASESSVYITQSLWSMLGGLDVPRFRRAWQTAVDRHPALRSAIYWEGLDTPQQVVFRNLPCSIDEKDWRDAEAQDRALESLIEEDRCRGLPLKEPPLSRISLRRLSDQVWRCLWTRHHILFDGWSQAVVLRDVYVAYAAGGEGGAMEPAVPYSAYIAWLRGQDRSRAQQFWTRLLENATPTPLRKAGVRQRFTAVSSAPVQDAIRLDNEHAHALTGLLRRRGLTLTSFALGLWTLLLSRLTNTADVLFGVTVSGRPPELRGVESMVGLFINTLPLRVAVTRETMFSDWLAGIMTRQAEIAEHTYCSLTEIHSWSGLPRTEPLFDSVVVVENYPKLDPGMASLCGLELSDFRSYVQSNYPLTLRVSSGDGCEFQLLYDSGRTEPGLAHVLLTQLQALLRSAADLLDARIEAADAILQRAEHEQAAVAARHMLANIRQRGENRNETVENGKCTRSV
jgi:hypothetical protein